MRDRKSTRLNSSHLVISYAVFCLKKKRKGARGQRRLLGRCRLHRDASPGAWGETLQECQRGRRHHHQRRRRDALLPFFFNDTATTEIYTLSLHDALPIYPQITILGLLKGEVTPKTVATAY